MDLTDMAQNFAVMGVGGYIAPRHLKAIKDTGNNLVAAVDPYDSVGILDKYFHNVKFFTEFERFDRHLEKQRRNRSEDKVDYITICTPNYLHDAHCRLALRLGVDTICEKPLVINPWNLDQLASLEAESEGKIHTMLQLRVHPELLKIKNQLDKIKTKSNHEVEITYITSRGPWYYSSWKGSPEKSGGIATNIGIHFFDMIQWMFGKFGENRVYLDEFDRMSGYVELEEAQVRWFLSLNESDLPPSSNKLGQKTYRSMTIDGEEVEFSSGFTDLHTEVYKRTLAGDGFGIEDVRASIELTHEIRNCTTSKIDKYAHPYLRK